MIEQQQIFAPNLSTKNIYNKAFKETNQLSLKFCYQFSIYHVHPLIQKKNIIIKKKMSLNSIVSLFFSLVLLSQVNCLKLSAPLSMCGDLQCQLSLKLTNSQYILTILNQYLAQVKYFVFCLRERTVIDGQDNTCQIDGLDNSYTCFNLYPTAISSGKVTSVQMYQWVYDSTLTQATNNATSSLGVNVGGTSIQITLTTLLTQNKIYEVYAGPSNALAVSTDTAYLRVKNAFFNTFKTSAMTSSDDLMMQRHPHCFVFYYSNDLGQSYYNYNLVFYGGVIRQLNQTMFFSVVSYLQTPNRTFSSTVNLNAYIGLSLSLSHASRDMMAFITANSTIQDLFSLYYRAPYLDESPSIQGQKNILQVADSNKYRKTSPAFFYFGTLVRLYDTGDFAGDQIIRKKINNTYCLSIGWNRTNSMEFPYSVTAEGNQHDNHGCFSSTVELGATWMVLSVLGTIVGMLMAF